MPGCCIVEHSTASIIGINPIGVASRDGEAIQCRTGYTGDHVVNVFRVVGESHIIAIQVAAQVVTLTAGLRLVRSVSVPANPP